MGSQDPQDPGSQAPEQEAPSGPPDTVEAAPPAAQPQQPAPQPASGGGGLTPFQQHFADFWHSKGMSDAGIAGMLGTAHFEAPQGYTSYNQESGASGAYQYLASRATGEQQYAARHGLDPWHPDAQNGFAYSEIQPGGPEFDNAGKYLWEAKDPRFAADVMVKGFERPGPVATPIESHGAQGVAAALYPSIQARFASQTQTTPEAPAAPVQDTAGADAAESSYGQFLSKPVGQGKFDNVKMPGNLPDPAPPQSGVDAAEQGYSQWMAKANAARAAGNAPPVTAGTDWGSFGSALKELPRGIGRGALRALGFPEDAIEWANHYFAAHPHNAELVGLPLGEPSKPGGEIAPMPATAQKFGVSSEDLMKQVKYETGHNDLQSLITGDNGGLDLHQQDQSIGGTILGDMGEFIGAGASPTGLGKDALSMLRNPKTSTALGAILHHVLMPAGASGGLDAGKFAVDEAQQNNWISPGTADAIGIAGRIGLGALAIRGMMTGGAIKEAGAKAISPAGQAEHMFESQYATPEEAAQAKAGALSEIENFDPNSIAPGYQAPAAYRSSSRPLQQWAQNITERNEATLGHQDANRGAIEAMRPQGDASDAMTALSNDRASRQKAIEAGVRQALTNADQAADIAATGSSGTQLPWGGGEGAASKFDKGQATVQALQAVRDDAAKNIVDAQWQVARDQGLTTSPGLTTKMYPEVEALMAPYIRGGKGVFPFDVTRELYQKDPRTMFDPVGNRLPGADAGRLYTDQNTTLDDLQRLSSNVGNALRIEQDKIAAPGMGGSPQRYRLLTQLSNIIDGAVDDSAERSGTSFALQTARDATKQFKTNFVGEGGLGDILSGRVAAADAPARLQQWLGNSNSAMEAAQKLKSALAFHSGADALRTAAPDTPPAALQQQFHNNMADWLRQDYVNTVAGARSKTAGQQWLDAHNGFFQKMQGNPTYDQLQQELQAHANVGDPTMLGNYQKAAEQSERELDLSAAGRVLNGMTNGKGVPYALDTILKAPATVQGKMMAQLLGAAVKGDPSLAGFRGVQRMLWDRVMLAATRTDPMNPTANYYSFGQAKSFVDGAKPAFDAMRAADPKWSANMDRLLNTMVMEDRSRLNPGLQLPEAATPKRSAIGMGRDALVRLGQIGFSRLMGPLLEGHGMANSMQAVGQSSAWFRGAAQGLISKQTAARIARLDPTARAQSAIEEALMDTHDDPTKIRALLTPYTGSSGYKWAAGVEPWLRASGVELPQGWLNPQQPAGPGE